MPAVLRDRLAVSAHVEILSSLLTLSAPRVLELRPRFGAIGAAHPAAVRRRDLRAAAVRGAAADRVRGVRHAAPTRCSTTTVRIPYDGSFDLVSPTT
jgi:hypothetical protein